jgi:hypothetical protein
MSSFPAWSLALVLGACAARTSPSISPPPLRTESRSIPERALVERIELCKTTETDLRASFGASMRDGRLGRHRVQSWVLGKDPELILAVLLDGRGVVVDLYWDAPGAVSWVPRDECGAAH